jgi:hypothetical protein
MQGSFVNHVMTQEELEVDVMPNLECFIVEEDS